MPVVKKARIGRPVCPPTGAPRAHNAHPSERRRPDLPRYIDSGAIRQVAGFWRLREDRPRAPWRRPAIALRTPRPRSLPPVRQIRASRSPRLLDFRPRDTPYAIGFSGGFGASSPKPMEDCLIIRRIIGGDRREAAAASRGGVGDFPCVFLGNDEYLTKTRLAGLSPNYIHKTPRPF